MHCMYMYMYVQCTCAYTWKGLGTRLGMERQCVAILRILLEYYFAHCGIVCVYVHNMMFHTNVYVHMHTYTLKCTKCTYVYSCTY